MGTNTNDYIESNGYSKVDAGAGNDTIVFEEVDDSSINGGSGFDTLLVDSTVIDFSDLSGVINNIESIDLGTGDSGKTISLELSDVLNMTDDTNTLQIEGDSNDELHIDSSKWDRGDIDADGFREYNSKSEIDTNGSGEYTLNSEDPTVILKIDDDIKVDGF